MVDTDESLRRWMVNTADEHGAAVMHIAGDDSGAPYAFSVGAWRRFGKPEVVVIGLPQEVAHTVVNLYVQRVGQGERFQPGRLYDGFLQGCPVTFEKIALQHYPQYLGSAFLVYKGADFPAMQMIVSSPDDAKFPWEPDAPRGFAEYQPILTDTGQPQSWTPGQDGP